MSTPVGCRYPRCLPIPDVPVPEQGFLVPSEASGFGMEIDEQWIRPWEHGQVKTAGGKVVL
ncbi:MAG: hypothetical protein ACKVJG_23810 [Candidatus Latescibacterota bacterium]|jgi:hypothetical protein